MPKNIMKHQSKDTFPAESIQTPLENDKLISKEPTSVDNTTDKSETDPPISVSTPNFDVDLRPEGPKKTLPMKTSFLFPKNKENSKIFKAILYGDIDKNKVLNETRSMNLSLDRLRYFVSAISELDAIDYYVDDETYLNELLEWNPNYVPIAAAKVSLIEAGNCSIHHDEDHFTGFLHGQNFLAVFETLPTRNDKIAEVLMEKYKKPVLILPWIDQSALPQRNLCGYLSVLALMHLHALTMEECKEQFAYVFDEECSSDYDDDLSDIVEEKKKAKTPTALPKPEITPATTTPPRTQKKRKSSYSDSDVPIHYQTTDDEYDSAYKSKHPVKEVDPVSEEDEEDHLSNFEEMKKMLAFVKDYTADFFREVDVKAALFVTAITANFFSLIYMAYNIVKSKDIKKPMIAAIVSFISLILTALITLDSTFDYPKISLERLFDLVRSYWTPDITYNIRDKPEDLIDERPSAAQILQLRQHVKKPATLFKIRDSQLLSHIEKFPPRLLIEDEILAIFRDLEQPKKQAKTFEEIIDQVMSPIAAVLVLFGIFLPSDEKTPHFIERTMKVVKSKLAEIKTHKENMLGIREQFLDFFNPNHTLTNRLIKQKRANLEAIQPPIAILATNPDKYNRLMKALNNSNQLSRSVMSANGKNVMFQAYMTSVSAVENKVMEYRRAITDVLGRQEPTAVYFHGPKGIGKSTMLTTVMNRDICKRLGLKPTTFNARVNPDGFYSVYCGETVAYMDEIGDEQDSRKVFELINQLLSTTSVNIPSAFVKDQPFVSPFLFLISNYPLTESLSTSGKKAETASAMRSRFVEIEIRNPQVDTSKPRGHNREWYDITNFEFYEYDNSLDNSILAPKKHKISYEQVLDRILGNYTTRLENFKTKVNNAIPQHQAITNPFSIVYAGPQDTGKTTSANQLVHSLSTVFPHLPVYRYDRIPEKIEKGPQICLLNDVITATNINQLGVLHQLEDLGKDGIVVSTSNVARELVTWYDLFTNICLFKALILNILAGRTISKPSIYKAIFSDVGLYRRLGYSGAYFINGNIENVASSSSCYVESAPGYLYTLASKQYTANEINHAILLNLEHHRSGATSSFKETNLQERENANWHAFFSSNSLEDLLSFHSTLSLSDISYDRIENGKLAIRKNINELAGSTINPDTFRCLNLTPSNCHETIIGYLTHVIKNIPKLNFTLRVGNIFYWTENGSVLHNKPEIEGKYEVVDDVIVDKSTGVTVTIEEYAKFYTTGMANVSVTQNLLVHTLKNANFIPQGHTDKFDIIITDSVDTITLTRTNLYAMEMKARFRKSYFYLFIGFFLSLLSGYALYKVFTRTNEKKQGKRTNKGYGIGKRSGKRYVVRASGVVYSGDEGWREDLYEDMMDRDDEDVVNVVTKVGKRRNIFPRRGLPVSKSEDYAIGDFDYEQLTIQPQADTSRKTIYLDHEYFTNLHSLSKAGGYGMKIVVRRGLRYDQQNLCVRDSSNPSVFFNTRCCQSVVFDSLGDLLTIDNNLRDMGFNSFAQLKRFLKPNEQFQILTTTAKTSKPYVGLTNSEIQDIYDGKLRYLQTIIDNPLNTNRVVSLDDGQLHPIVISKLQEKPDGPIGGIKEFASKKRFYFEVVGYDNPHHEFIDNSIRNVSAQDNLIAAVKQNAVIVEGLGRTGGFFINKDWVLTVKHVLSHEKHKNQVFEQIDGKMISYDIVEVIPHPNCDYALLNVSSKIPQKAHKSLVKNIYDGPIFNDSIPVTIAALSNEPAYLVNARLNSKATEIDSDQCLPLTVFTGQFSVLTMERITRAGDCGRPYIYTDNMGISKIVAIHFAGSAFSALGIRIDYKWIVDNLERACTRKQSTLRYAVPEFTERLSLIGPNERKLKSPDQPYSQPSVLAQYLGEFLPSMKQPVKTNLNQCTPSELASLRKNAFGEPDFFLDQILQYNDPVLDFPSNRANAFVSGFISEFNKYFSGHHAGRILTDTECLNGIREPQDLLCNYTNSLNWNGSIGYECQTKYRNVHIMRDIVDFDDTVAHFNDTGAAHFISERFSRHVIDAWDGIRHVDILQDNLKQENRVNEKAYKQRVFTSFPKSLSMFIRKFTLRFASTISKYHDILPYKIGLDAYSEWHPMHMQAIGFAGREPTGFGFDLSRCDKHMTPQFFEGILKPIMAFFIQYEHRKSTCNCNHDLEQHLNALDVVTEHLYHNIVASQDCLYEKYTGNSSGSDLTIVINSIYVDWLIFNFYVTAAKTSRIFPPTYAAYRSTMLPWTCGDDAKITVKAFPEFLNFVCMKKYLATHGITIDTPLKDGKEEPIAKIVDIPFVSRSWVLSPHGYYIPKFKEEVLSGLIYWTSEHTMEHIDNILSVLVEHTTAYGKEAYQKLQTMIYNYQANHESNFIVPTYEESLQVLETRIVGFAIIHKENISSYDQNIYPISKQMSKVPQTFLFDVRSLLIGEVSYIIKFFNARRKYLSALAQQHGFDYPKSSPLRINEYAMLFYVGDNPSEGYVSIESLSKPLKQELTIDPLMNAQIYLHRELRNKLFIINGRNAGNIWVEAKILENLVSETISSLPLRAVKQMERRPENPTQAFENTVPQMNQQIHSSTMTAQPAMTPMTVEHLPQLATQLPPQQIPTLLNAPLHDTITFGMPTETRTSYLPPDSMAFGGVLEDLKDLALGSYQVNEIINVPVNTQQGTILFRKKYGLDMLGGYAKRWVNLHKRYTGPITFRVRIVSTSIVQGNIRIGWNLGDDTVINIDNSSKFGAVDFDLSQPNNEFDFTIQPIAEATGRFFFTTDEEPKDQGFIYAMLLTPITNNFSDLGSIQMIVESRLHPNFCLADPLDVDVDAVGLTTEFNDVLQTSDLDLSSSTIFIETRKYPKYPVALPGIEEVRDLRLNDFIIGRRASADFGRTPMSELTSSLAVFYSDVRDNARNVPQTPFRSTSVEIADPQGTYFGTDGVPVDFDEPLEFRYETFDIDGKLKSIQSLTLPIVNLAEENRTIVNTNYEPELVKGSIVLANASGELDTNTLPNGYYTVEIGPVTLPSLSPQAAALNFNVVPRSDVGWVLYNYCNTNCPDGGQVKVSLVDRIFQTTQCEFLFRKEIGFFTSATEAQRFSFLDSALNAFDFHITLYRDRSNVVLRNDLPSFTPMTTNTRRFRKQMFSIMGAAGGLLGGLGQGLTQMNQNNFEHQMQDDRLKNNIDLQNMQGDQALAQINATGNMTLQNTGLLGQNSLANIEQQGEQERKTMDRQFSLTNANNNLFRSPMNRAANHMRNAATQAGPTQTRNRPVMPTTSIGTAGRQGTTLNPSNRAGVMPISGTGRYVSAC